MIGLSQLVIGCINAVLLGGGLALLVLSLVLLLECAAALLPTASASDKACGKDVSVGVLVPAHNEEMGLSAALAGLLPFLKARDRLIVIADNCTDGTAAIARACGATVIERHDPNRRGKGYALDYGLKYLESNPPDVVVFADADCHAEPGAIEMISRRAIETGRPVQAVYLMEKPNPASPKDAVSAFAFKVKNLVRASGLARFGMPCLLTGTGMAFPWETIRAADLASSNVVEDMKLGLDLTIAGHPPLLCREANMIGILPQNQSAAEMQRTRWEHGHMQMLLTYVPKLLQEAVQQRRLDLLVMALDMFVPPLSLLVMLWAATTAVATVAAVLGAAWLPAVLCAAAGGCLAIAVLSAWVKFGQADMPLLDLLAIPFYVLWKIPLYLKFLVQPQNEWVRTARNSASVAALNTAAQKLLDISKL